MPRPIHVPQGTDALASYTLSANEEWTLLAATFSLVPISGSGGDNQAFLDMRDPAGAIIYMQPLAWDDGGNMFYSLAVDADPFASSNSIPGPPNSYNHAWSYSYVSQRLSPQTLYTGCSINAYKTLGSDSPPTDPITNVSTYYTIPDLHLWVQDVSGAQQLPATPEPLLTHVAV